MSDTWGKGSVNNNIGWGQAAGSATNDWGKSQKESWAGQTDIVGITSVSITYSSSAFCSDANDPTPTISNNAGAGTFSSTAGLVFISTTTGEVDISGSTAGSYVITYTDTDAATATFDLAINTIPTVTVSASAGTICDGESTILTASGANSYTWSNGGTGASITVSPSTTTLFTATGTDSNGCTSSGGTTITVNALPTVEITGTLTYCAGSTTTLTATAGLSSYLWSNGETTQSVDVTAGSYTVTGTDSNGCSATSSASTVTELPLDSATVTYSSSDYCQVPTGALAVDGYYPLYATESAAEAESSDGTAHSHTLSGTTYYMPNDGVTIYHGTYSLTTPAPTITGETGTFSESTGNLSIDSSTGVITLNSSTAGTYTVVYTTNGSCPNTVNNTITINSLDGATFAYSSSSLPQTGTASLTTTPTTSGGVYSAYPSGLSINSSTGEIDLAASTIQSYKIFYETSGAGCPNSSTFDLAVTAAGLANNYSMSFDGSNDKIIVDTSVNSVLPTGMNPFSFSIWFNVDSVSNSYNEFFGYGQPGVGLSGVRIYGTVFKHVSVNNPYGQDLNSTTVIQTGQWYHGVVTFDGTTRRIYVNGVEEANDTPTFTILPSDSYPLTIGVFPSRTKYTNGKLDEVAIWNTALTSTQVSEIYNATGTNLTKDLTTVSGSNLIYWNRMGD